MTCSMAREDRDAAKSTRWKCLSDDLNNNGFD